MSWPEGTKLGWAMPLSWPYINSTTHMSLMAVNRPDFVYLETSQSGDIAEKRELQVQHGMGMGCTHFVLLDADMVYPPQIIEDLFSVLEEGADLAGAVCYRGDVPYDPMIWHLTEERLLKPFHDYQFGDLVDAGATGAACVLIKREVFEGVRRPWFRIALEETTKDGKTLVIKRGEDTYFTRNATKAGFKLKIITKYDIGHLREFSIDRHFWLTFGILNQCGSWENVIKLFKKMRDKEWFEREIAQPKTTEGGRENA